MTCAGCPYHVTDHYGFNAPLCLAGDHCIDEEESMPEQLEVKPDSRVRMNFGMNAKGLVQMDITVEMPTTAEAEAEARLAIDSYRAICAAKGLKLADAGAA